MRRHRRAQDWQEIATIGHKRHDGLKRFLRLPHGIPPHDTFERVFRRLSPQVFQACFQSWVRALQEALTIQHVAVDHKTLRSSGTAKLGPLHLVSAWATDQGLSLGQVAVDGKSNGITAIPVLLDLLDLNGALVTVDAKGCQKAIAQKIVDRGGDYVLNVKENQERLLADVQQALAAAFDSAFAGVEHDCYETRENGHGREEYRCCIVVHATEHVRDAAAWAKLTTIELCHSERLVQGVSGQEYRNFIGSKPASAKQYGKALRKHWGVETQHRQETLRSRLGPRFPRRDPARRWHPGEAVMHVPRLLTP